jgi:hypothetical protein
MELNDTNFEQITASGNWVVCYYYSWCKPCHKLIKMLNSSYNNQNKINLGKVVQFNVSPFVFIKIGL